MADSPLPSYPYPKVIGINLVVLSGDDPSRTLTFFKYATPVVNIGRMPSTRLPLTEDDTAWFRCAVVSRKHAKIVFSDSGQVYIVDLCSHHGTQILKSAETLSKTIAPESPTPLNDGDIITFGKSVGKDINLVRPVSARINFILQSRSAFDHQKSDLTDESFEFPYKPSPTKSSTGRYGVTYLSSASSSSSSDIEEVSGPNILPIRPSSHEDLEVRSRRGLGLLKHILPPISIPTTPSRSPSPPPDAYDDNRDGGIIVGDEPKTNCHELSHHADMSLPPSPAATRSTPSPPANRYDSVFETDPSVIGAWPGSPVSPISPPESPVLLWEPIMFPEISDVPDEIRQLLDMEAQEQDTSVDADPDMVVSEQEEVDELKRSQSPYFFEDNGAHNESAPEGKLAKQDDVVTDVDKHVELKEQVSKIKATVDQVSSDVQILRNSKRKAAKHIHRAEQKLENLDKRLTNIDSLCSSHSNFISDMTEAETSRMTSIVAKGDSEEEKSAALNALLEEIRAFREQTSKQIAEEVETLKAAREEALATIKTLTAQVQAQMSPSLKRKRSEDAFDDEEIEHDLLTPRIKRTKGHIVLKVLKTAGVFTVGAVATWSALAFS